MQYQQFSPILPRQTHTRSPSRNRQTVNRNSQHSPRGLVTVTPKPQFQVIQQPQVVLQPVQKDINDANELIRVQQNRIIHLEDKIRIIQEDFNRYQTQIDFKNKELEQWQIAYNNMQNQLNQRIQNVRQLETFVEQAKTDHKQFFNTSEQKQLELLHFQSLLADRKEEYSYNKNKLQDIEEAQKQLVDLESKHRLLMIENANLKQLPQNSQFLQNQEQNYPGMANSMYLGQPNVNPYGSVGSQYNQQQQQQGYGGQQMQQSGQGYNQYGGGPGQGQNPYGGGYGQQSFGGPNQGQQMGRQPTFGGSGYA